MYKYTTHESEGAIAKTIYIEFISIEKSFFLFSFEKISQIVTIKDDLILFIYNDVLMIFLLLTFFFYCQSHHVIVTSCDFKIMKENINRLML